MLNPAYIYHRSARGLSLEGVEECGQRSEARAHAATPEGSASTPLIDGRPSLGPNDLSCLVSDGVRWLAVDAAPQAFPTYNNVLPDVFICAYASNVLGANKTMFAIRL
ncbi:hypothetical protein B5X24_HaOG205869 [Helicoverpa armigera]|nr:hypothetical protein B5X24_HaOG205869 [Helicoverpa armigera]